MYARTFTTTTRTAFKKESVTQFINLVKPAGTATKVVNAPQKWQPTHGNSFRSFAEYRLKVTNQSPLALKFRSAKK